MTIWSKSHLIVAVLVSLGASSSRAEWKRGQVLPDLRRAGLEGTVPDLKGKVVLVDFWGSWCGPCKASFPVMDELYARYKEQGFEIVAVSVDEEAEKAERFLKDHAVGFATPRDAAQRLVSDAAPETMPTSYLVDRRGRIAVVHHGFRGEATRKELVAEIEKLLKEVAP